VVQAQWVLIRHHLLEPDDVIVMGGDESGRDEIGQSRRMASIAFFPSLYGKAVPGLCFLRLSLISVKRRTSYPVIDGTN